MENKSVQLVTKEVIMEAADKKAISNIKSVHDIAQNLAGFTFTAKMCNMIFADGKEYCTAQDFVDAIKKCADRSFNDDKTTGISAILIPIIGIKFTMELENILFPEE